MFYSGLSTITTDYCNRLPRLRKMCVFGFSMVVLGGMLININIKDDCGFVLTIRKIFNLKPHKNFGEYPFWYEYEEDKNEEQKNCICQNIFEEKSES